MIISAETQRKIKVKLEFPAHINLLNVKSLLPTYTCLKKQKTKKTKNTTNRYASTQRNMNPEGRRGKGE